MRLSSIWALALLCVSLVSAEPKGKDKKPLDTTFDPKSQANKLDETFVNLEGLPKCVKHCIDRHKHAASMIEAKVNEVCWYNQNMLKLEPVRFSLPIAKIDDDRLWNCYWAHCGSEEQREEVAQLTRDYFRKEVCGWDS